MRLQRDRRVGHRTADVTPDVQIIFLVARISDRAQRIAAPLAQRFLLGRIGDADQTLDRAQFARQLHIGLGEVGGVGARRIHVPGKADVQRRAAQRDRIAGEQVEFHVGAAEPTPAAEVRSPGADIGAAFMRCGDAALDGHALVALRHATEPIVGNERHAARDGHGARGFFLSEGRRARQQSEGGTGDVILHETFPFMARMFRPASAQGPWILMSQVPAE